MRFTSDVCVRAHDVQTETLSEQLTKLLKNFQNGLLNEDELKAKVKKIVEN